MEISYRRIYLEDNKECWNLYNSDIGASDSSAVVFFSKQENLVFLLSQSEESLRNEDMLSAACNLVHDLPVNFRVIQIKLESDSMEYIPEELIEICSENAPK